MRQFYLLLFAFPILTDCFSQNLENSQLKFRWLTVENGLSNNRTTTITKCKKGYIWIGTDDGINRFDGKNCFYYHLYSGNRDLDKWNQQVTSSFTDSKGNLWVGSYTLFKYDYEKDSLNAYYSGNDTTQPLRIRSIKEYKNKLWIGARQGLFSIDINTGKSTYYPFSVSQKIREIWDISIHENKIWFGTENSGMYVFDIQFKKYQKISVRNSKNKEINQILSVYRDYSNLIWIGTKDDGLFNFNPNTNHNPVPVEIKPFTNRIRKIICDKYDNLWIGTVDGLYLKSKNNSTILRIAHEEHPISQLSQNSIHNLYIDNYGIIWLSTFAGGVCYADLFKKKIIHYISNTNNNNFVNSKNITGFAADIARNLYIATDSSGINVLDPKTGIFKVIPMGKTKINGKTIRCLSFDSNNILWVGCYQGGITKYNISTNKFEHITSKSEPLGQLQSNSIYSLSIDNQNNIWVGSNKGIDFIDSKTNKITPIYTNNGIHYVYIDSEGGIWSGVSDDGVFKFNKTTGKFETFCEEYNLVSLTTLYRDSEGNLWVGEKSGLVYINTKTLSYRKYTRNNGLPNNTIQGIIEDNHKNIWLTTASGIAKCENAAKSPNNFTVKKYFKGDGLQGDYFLKNSIFKDVDGNLYLGGINGFNKFSPDSIKDDTDVPDLNFSKLIISNTEIIPNQLFNGKIILTKTLPFSNTINLSYKYKSITFEFIALHYSNPENIKYAYKLYPLEKEWNYSSSERNFASYYSIPPGNYTLMVKASNNDEIWNNNFISLKVIIPPPFWKKPWFISISAVLLIIMVIVINRMLLSNIQRQKLKLELLVEERTRELNQKNRDLYAHQSQILEQSSELSKQKENLEELNAMKDKLFSIIAHDLKNPFNSLLGFSDILVEKFKTLPEEKKIKYIELINGSSKKIYKLLENLLFWARAQINQVPFDPQKTELSELIQLNIKFLEVEYWSKGIQIFNHIPSPFFAVLDKNMMNVVFRNLLSNAIKFSYNQGVIEIDLFEHTNNIEIVISDHGIGVVPENLKKLFELGSSVRRQGTMGEDGTGLGLLLCKEFVEKHGGGIWAESRPGDGTSIHFTFPKTT